MPTTTPTAPAQVAYIKADGSYGYTSDPNSMPGADPHSGTQTVPPAPPPPANPPAGGTTGATDPTIANSPVRRYTSGGSVTDQANNIYSSMATGPVDENQIRADMRQQAQGQLDAINGAYDSIIAQDKVTAEGKAGATRALQARSGNLGSDFGNGAIGTDKQASDAIQATHNAARASAIAQVLANVDTRADSRITAEKTLRTTNQEAYLKHLEDSANTARTDVITLSKSGVGYDQLTQDQYTKLLDQTGYTPEQLKAQFILNQPDPIYKGISGSKYIVVTRNPTTGATKSDSFDLGFTPPQDYQSTTLDTGQIIFTPKNWDGDPKKIVTYGTPSEKYKSEVARNYAAAAKDNRDKGSNPTSEYKIGSSARNDLLKYGLPAPQIDSLQKDIQTYGLKKAIEGLDPTTGQTIQQILDKNYVVSG